MNATMIRHLYRRFRDAGWTPPHALDSARTVAKFRTAEREYEIRIRAVPEEESYFAVYGEPEGYTDAHGRFVTPDEERRQIAESIDRDGCWTVLAEVMNDDGEWQCVDSVGMCAGYSDPESPFENDYVVDLMAACLGACDTVGAELTDSEIAEFTDAYLVALAFTATTERNGEIGEAPDAWTNPGGDIRDVVTADDVRAVLSAEDLAEVESDCAAFLADNRDDIGDDIERAGADFHLTRNRHGAGFWDGDWPDDAGRRLTYAAHTYGTQDLVVSEDPDTGEVTRGWLCH